MSIRKSSKLAASCVLAAVIITCVGPLPFDDMLRPVVVDDQDGGADAGPDTPPPDAAVDAGPRKWRIIAREILPRPEYEVFGGNVFSLGVNGVVAGYSYEEAIHSWLAEPTSGYLLKWETAIGRPYEIRSVQADGWYCGWAPWPRDGGGEGGTAIIGTEGSAHRLLPDPLRSWCRDMNASRTTIGEWRAQGFLRWPDGGVQPFDFFRFPDGGFREGYILAEPRSINDLNEVVGMLQYGYFFGRGNPAGLYWSADAGPILLDNGIRYASANDINNPGQIVGVALDFNSLPVPTLWPSFREPAVYLPLPPSLITGEARSINGEGLIVGWGYDEHWEAHGVLWWKGKAYAADELVAGQVNAPVFMLQHVNDHGRIVGILRDTAYRPDGSVVRPYRPIVIDVLEYPE